MKTRTGWLFVDSVFPVRLGSWDLRHYLRYLREETLLAEIQHVLSTVKTHDFHVLSLEPHVKDGGVFVQFRYSADDQTPALDAIMQDLKGKTAEQGGMPSWLGLSRGNVWLVKGKPWHEDMRRFASPILKVAFEGPDVHEESLYELLRPFGRIEDITHPTPVPAGVLRSSFVTYQRLRSAAIAHNAVHGVSVSPSPSATTLTVLRTSYQVPIQAHAVRDYVTNHPRIFLPVLFFLVGTLTYTIFDPIRTLMVEGKMEGWFNIKEFKLYQWFQTNALDRFSLTSTSRTDNSTPSHIEEVWKERRDAEGALERYLTDKPSTVAFVHGPQGSGKSAMIAASLKDTGRKAIVIDVKELSKASSDTALVTGLAVQTGYWPVFSIFNSINNLIDLASVGLIGQKAGLSSSLEEQLKQILEVVGTGLTRVNAAHRSQRSHAVKQAHLAELRKEEGALVGARIRQGVWHDGRLDCLAGNGVMSELGVGDEWFGEADATEHHAPTSVEGNEKTAADKEAEVDELKRRQKNAEETHAVEAMPIVIIKGFESKGAGPNREVLLNVLAQWSAKVAQNQIAHVVVVSDNRENAKTLAQALPSQPLNLITLSDADKHSALSFVQQKLYDAGMQVSFTSGQRSYVERLGGRASDLESLIHKIRGGLTVEDAVEDIIVRGVGEIRKNAFGDEIEDAKNLPWTREQAWFLLKHLSKRPEISYHEVLMDFPFKGDEAPLRNLEHAELIAIGTLNGRPSTIRPGKPVYRYVFERLVGDVAFQATQDISFNEKVIASAEGTVKTCELELLTLKDVDAGTTRWYGSRSAVSSRGDYLLKKMKTAEEKIEVLEKQNATLKKILSKAG
ncbi:RNA12 protein-domain-containing protein [Amylocystis lapponica]|nr:RNA12 protein-domain-containing protein [Amylocystis lapponica]